MKIELMHSPHKFGGFTPTAIPTCTAVTLRWRVMSKGEFDAKWRVLEEDKAFRPSKLETIKRELEKEKCL